LNAVGSILSNVNTGSIFKLCQFGLKRSMKSNLRRLVMFNVPKLRFGEFEGEWVEKCLNKVSQINPKSKKLPNEFIYIDLESVDKGRLVKSNKILKNNAPSRAKRVLLSEDILFQTVRPYQKNNYFYKLDGSYVASTGYAQIRANESTRFLYHKLHTDKFVNNVLLRCTGTSYPAINSTDLSKIKIFLPKEKEQQKIATFLTSIDQKIEQLNQKRTFLESYKKGLMQKIFSQEIRFKRDDGGEFEDWEEKRLCEIVDIIDGDRGINYPKAHEFYENEHCLFLSAKNVTKNGFRFLEKQFISKEKDDVLSKGKLKKNDIILTTRGSVGHFAFYSKDIPFEHMRINSGMVILRSKDLNLLSEFLYKACASYSIKKQIKVIAFGSAQPQLTVKAIKKIKINLPCLEEQQKISTFLTSIDQKITQTNQSLEEMKAFKKGLLQQMFV